MHVYLHVYVNMYVCNIMDPDIGQCGTSYTVYEIRNFTINVTLDCCYTADTVVLKIYITNISKDYESFLNIRYRLVDRG